MRAWYDSDIETDDSDDDEYTGEDEWECDFCAARFATFVEAMVHEASHDEAAYAHEAARRIQKAFRSRRFVDGHFMV